MKYLNPISALDHIGGSLTIHVCMAIWGSWLIHSNKDALKSGFHYHQECEGDSKCSSHNHIDVVYMIIAHIICGT